MSNKHPVDCVSEATHVVTVEDRRPFVVNHQCLCTNFMAPEKSYRTCWSMWHIAEVVPLNHVICFIELVKHAAFLLHREGVLNNLFAFREKLHAGSMLMWWMHHLEKCTGVFIKNAHLNMVHMHLPRPHFSMLTHACDFC